MPRLAALSLVAGLLVLGGAPSAAGSFELTPIFGYRSGGSTHETESGSEADIQGSPVYGVILDIEAREDGQYEFLYTHQSTRLDPTDDSLPYDQEPPDIDTGLTIDTVQAGGLLFLGPRERWRPYMAMALGASLIDPEDSSLSGGTYFSGSLAGGVKLYLSEKVAARLEVRGYGIFVSESSEVACSGGGAGGVCYVGASGDAIWQFDASVGLSLSF